MKDKKSLSLIQEQRERNDGQLTQIEPFHEQTNVNEGFADKLPTIHSLTSIVWPYLLFLLG